MPKISLQEFPNSLIESFQDTSPQDPLYNCIAWTYGVQESWMWPAIYCSWPQNVPKISTINSFKELFSRIGYKECEDGDLEQDFLKVAIYEKEGNPTHAARQLESGLWTSKLGREWDVSHTIFSMADGEYGNVSVYMKRRITNR